MSPPASRSSPGAPGRTRGERQPRRLWSRDLARDDGYCATIFASIIVLTCIVATIMMLVFFGGIVGFTAMSYEEEQENPTDQAGHCVADVAGNQPDTYEELAIPKDFYDIYRSAGEEYDIPWPYLAAVGWVETKHGQWKGDGVNPTGLKRDETNHAGAAGPMQFGIDANMAAADTWSEYGVDGNGDGRKDVWDPRDAIPAAGNLISQTRDARGSIEDGIHRYNPGGYSGPESNPYVQQQVLPAARKYEDGDFTIAPAMGFLECEAPDANEDVADGVVTYVEAQIGKPHRFNATGPDEFGAAGLIHAAYADQDIEVPDDLDDLQDLPDAARIDVAEAGPGDVLFTASCNDDNDEDTTATHVLMITGDDTVVHANQQTEEVVEDDLDDHTGCRLVKVLRMSHLGD